MYRHKRIFNISRRDFLRGMGAFATVSIPLPLFDFMINSSGKAYAQSAFPLRFIIMKQGNGPCWDGDYRGTQKLKDINGNPRNNLTPLTYGANFTPGPGTGTLNNYSALKPYVGVFSNGQVPGVFSSTANTAASVPPGGISGRFHQVAQYVQATGRKVWIKEMHPDYNIHGKDPGASGDQLLKAQLNPNGRYIHANYAVQGSEGGDTLQFNSNGTGLPPTSNVRAIFLELFSNFTAPGTGPDPAVVAELEKRKSILDLLDKESVNFLNRELGAKEKSMLSDHFDFIRDLEQRISVERPPATTSACVKPADPGTTSRTFSQNADLISDLLAMALTCDIVRHGTFRLTRDQTNMAIPTVTRIQLGFHDSTHYGAHVDTEKTSTREAELATTFLTDKFFRLADKLRRTPEGNGNVLDNTVLLYMAEGGYGWSFEENKISAHSVENLSFLIAGRGGGIKTGSHVRLDGSHSAKVILSCMKAVGYTGNSLGSITGHDTKIWG